MTLYYPIDFRCMPWSALLPVRKVGDMRPAAPCYGLDIETDTEAGGLDPARARVLAAALARADGQVVFTGPEASLLRALDACISSLPAGVLVTWNGAAFDLPFLADRAGQAGVRLGLDLVLDPSIVRRRPPLPGHRGAYRASWHRHRHLDAYRAYRQQVAPVGQDGLSWGLKAVARRAGVPAVEVDASLVHLLPLGALQRYVASDAAVARQLALSRWTDMEGHIDAVAGRLSTPAARTRADRPRRRGSDGSRPPQGR